MFEGEKFLTIGVSESIPMELQIFMWDAIAKMAAPKDYLQVFELKVENGLQVIRHTAEEPAYDMTYILTTVTKTASAKVYVIDDYYADEDKHRATMLLAEEY